jgi:mannose-6-phosphate isomerase-like protein (cupin superfamily)
MLFLSKGVAKMIAGKTWGSTETIFKNDNFEIHRICIKKGYECSKHLHQYKYNMFYVESGELEIVVWKNDYDLIDSTIIKTGQNTSVSPNEYHKFISHSDVVAYEIYYSKPISGDIIRETCGGEVK